MRLEGSRPAVDAALPPPGLDTTPYAYLNIGIFTVGTSCHLQPKSYTAHMYVLGEGQWGRHHVLAGFWSSESMLGTTGNCYKDEYYAWCLPACMKGHPCQTCDARWSSLELVQSPDRRTEPRTILRSDVEENTRHEQSGNDQEPCCEYPGMLSHGQCRGRYIRTFTRSSNTFRLKNTLTT